VESEVRSVNRKTPIPQFHVRVYLAWAKQKTNC